MTGGSGGSRGRREGLIGRKGIRRRRRCGKRRKEAAAEEEMAIEVGGYTGCEDVSKEADNYGKVVAGVGQVRGPHTCTEEAIHTLTTGERERERNRLADRQAGTQKQTERLIDQQTDKQTGRQTKKDRHIDKSIRNLKQN